MSVHSRFLASVIILGLGVGCGAFAGAQEATPAVKPTSVPSSGLSASINNVSIQNGSNLTIQIVLTNVSDHRVYLIAYGSNKASTDNGAIGTYNEMSGVNHCAVFTGGGMDDSRSYEDCLNPNSNSNNNMTKDLNKYSYIEPHDQLAVSMSYNFPQSLTEAHTVSYVFRAIVRNTTGDPDTLPEGEAEKAVGRLHTVNLNFSLLPIKKFD